MTDPAGREDMDVDDSSSDDPTVCIGLCLWTSRRRDTATESNRQIRGRRERRIRYARGRELVEECLANDARCMNMTRMNSSCLQELVHLCRVKYDVRSVRERISLELQVVMVLNYLAHARSMGRVSTMFGPFKDTISKAVKKMLPALCQLAVDECLPVNQEFVHPKLKTSSVRQAFQGCLGAIDGTHVRVHPNPEEENLWRGRFTKSTAHVLAIYDHDLLFTYFLVGAEGAMHDTKLLDIARNNAVYRFPHPATGRYYLVDSGYVNRDGYLAPYLQTRYHPHEFQRSGPQNEKEFFNQQQSSIRCCIERAFGVWKNKWHIVHYSGCLKGFSMQKQLAIIEITAGLHNFVRRRMGNVYLEPVDPPRLLVEPLVLDLNRSPPLEEEEPIFAPHWDSTRDEIAATISQFRK